MNPCPDCNGTGEYVPLVGPPEPCRKCAPQITFGGESSFSPECADVVELDNPPLEFTPVALTPRKLRVTVGGTPASTASLIAMLDGWECVPPLVAMLDGCGPVLTLPENLRAGSVIETQHAALKPPCSVGRYRVPGGEWRPFEYENSTVYVFGESHVKPGEPHFRLELRGVRTESLAKACPVNGTIELGTDDFTERFKPLEVAEKDDGTWTLRFTYPENP